ncbi:FAD-linked oxidase C-terminal domain-containing protein [Candidatus Njordibacter sp. Uisw_039]|jgi:glycolate oxidase|uniref:FAD-linked oxidase C-terminal domain-containing protein n=1 Tax=Candidatus Njordibacter sp. Uisw_039 TaxID=3230972 RepID=UPI003A3F23C4|tara:strand:+ start:1575 stop:3047 length:1473 start_codon:yes stop_codon:yes gene_type:complete
MDTILSTSDTHSKQGSEGGDVAALVSSLQLLLPASSIIISTESQRPFECDGLAVYQQLPLVTVIPETVDQVQAILRLCHLHRVPLVPRGAGTGLCAGAMPHAEGVLLVMSKLDKILHINQNTATATVQPGVRNLALTDAAQPFGLYYAPDPSSQIACTIGGNVAENSGGVHCLKYGLTVNNLLQVTMITIEGQVIILGGEGLDEPGMDLLSLVVGSEGLLGVVVEAKVKLLPRAPRVQVLLAAYDSVTAAGDAVAALIGQGIIPAGLEMMDHLAISAAEDFVKVGYPTDAQALLICELDGTDAEVEEQLAVVSQCFTEHGAHHIRIAKDAAEAEALWQGRKAAFPAVGRISPDYYCMDGTIPRGQVGYVLTRISELSRSYGLRVANVFHAGDGNLHPLILFDASVDGELQQAELLGGDILTLCVDVGGTITGEHGVGLEKMQQMPYQFGDAELAQFRRLKAAFDSEELLNPGKGIPTLKYCQEYRSLQHG